MNLIAKLAYICLFITLSISLQAQCLTGRRIETFTGDSVLFSCPGSNDDNVSFKLFVASTPSLYIVTDRFDTIRKLAPTSRINFRELTGTEFRVYGCSYKGPVNNVIGKPLKTAVISSLCAARSVNYITVIREAPMPPIIDAQSGSPLFVCAPDNKPDFISVHALFPSKSMARYIVIDEKNKIVAIQDQNKIDANNLSCQTCKFYAVSFTGLFTAKIGQSVSDPLSSDCSAISQNFITAVRDLARGGTIRLSDPSSPLFICSTSTKAQSILTQLTGNSAGNQAYILTDTLNKVLALQNTSVIPSNILAAGICRLWGVTFTGTLIQSDYIGKSIHTVVWSDDCFAVTLNNLAITKMQPNGGAVTLMDNNEKSLIICKDDIPDVTRFKASGVVGLQNSWVLTSVSGKIISWTTASEIDLNGLSVGDYRLYNLAYTGNLILAKDSLFTKAASDDCYDYSDDYISIHVDIPVAGRLSFEDGLVDKFVCSNDPAALRVKFKYTGQSGLKSVFLLTDSSGFYLKSFNQPDVDFTSLSNSKYKIYAASYSGIQNITPGQHISSTNLFSGCFSLSSPALSVTKGEVREGKISFQSGKDSIVICTNSNLISVQLRSDLKHTTSFAYVLTNNQDTVIRILSKDTFTISNTLKGICKFWAIAYTGDLSLKPGDPIKKTSISTGCADVSINFLTLIKDQPQGANVYFNKNDTSYQICYKDGWPDLVSLHTTSGSTLPYQFVATDQDNHILAFNISNTNFETIPNGITKIYGISYLGPILANFGDDITKVVFAADCFELSKNAIQVSGDEIRAGIIRSNKNSENILFCNSTGSIDTIRFNFNGATTGTSYYYIGIQSDTIRFVSNSGIILSTDILPGHTDVYGIAFKGKFLAQVGDKLSARRLVDSCYGVSSNSIGFGKYTPDAGMVTSGSGLSDIYLCPGDGQADFITLSNIGATPLNYGYFITNSKDSIVAFSPSSSIDLDTFPIGLCKIYGISYLGNISYKNKKVQEPGLASACFSISKNAINVHKSLADGGRISLAKGDTAINICVEDLALDTIKFYHSSPVQLKYSYLVTDGNNRLQSIVQENELRDFNGSDPGVCRVYGISYGGFLNVFRNDNVLTATLASGCYDLSDNFLTINKSNTGANCKNIGVNDGNKAFLGIYPNPARDFVRVSIKSKYLKGGHPVLTLVAASGGGNKKIILDPQVVDNQNIEISTAELTSGMYFLMFKNGYIFDKLKIIVIK